MLSYWQLDCGPSVKAHLGAHGSHTTVTNDQKRNVTTALSFGTYGEYS